MAKRSSFFKIDESANLRDVYCCLHDYMRKFAPKQKITKVEIEYHEGSEEATVKFEYDWTESKTSPNPPEDFTAARS